MLFVKLTLLVIQRIRIFLGNTRTGASAATDDATSEDTRLPSHSSSSPLVAHNAAFINELGGEEVRNVALTRATASKRMQQIIAGKLMETE